MRWVEEKEGRMRTMLGYLLAVIMFPLLSTTMSCLSCSSPALAPVSHTEKLATGWAAILLTG